MKSRGPQRRRKPPVPRAEIARKRLASLYSRWGSPTPPSGREVLRIVAKSNASRMQSAQRQRRKQSTSDAFRRRKAQRREYWRRRLGQAPEVGMGQGQGSSATTTQTPKIIPAQERRGSGMARKGPVSTLTAELAQRLAGYMEFTDWSIREIAEKTGTPATTIRHWARSGRIASVLEAHRLEPRPPASESDRLNTLNT